MYEETVYISSMFADHLFKATQTLVYLSHEITVEFPTLYYSIARLIEHSNHPELGARW